MAECEAMAKDDAACLGSFAENFESIEKLFSANEGLAVELAVKTYRSMVEKAARKKSEEEKKVEQQRVSSQVKLDKAAALQPKPIAVVSACLPWAPAFLNRLSRLKATRGR